MKLLEQFLIREPDQIVEANRNERFSILDLQFKLGALGGVLKAVEDIAERRRCHSSARAAFLKSSSLTVCPICRPVAAMISSDL